MAVDEPELDLGDVQMQQGQQDEILAPALGLPSLPPFCAHGSLLTTRTALPSKEDIEQALLEKRKEVYLMSACMCICTC